jgi:HPt (histidine-containing phosphotransfer) domain-containing protein
VIPTEPSTQPQKLVSQLLVEDAGLRDIVEEFVAALPGRLAELKQAYSMLDWDMLTMLAHRLKGASGSYGYPDLSQLAAQMEQGFKEQHADQFQTWTQQMDELIAAVKAGMSETPSASE